MRLFALFGIESGGVSIAVNLVLLFLVAVWFALIYWTYSDAKRRIADPIVVACATGASMFPFLGTIVYLILRPPEYLEDVHERELEIAAAEARLVELHDHVCPNCGFPVERAFLRCPSCLRRLKEPCAQCRKPLDPRWKICPYCEAEVGKAPPPRRRRAPAQATRAAKRPAARSQRPAAASDSGDGAPMTPSTAAGRAPADRPATTRSRPSPS